MRTHLCAIALLIVAVTLQMTAERRVPKDLSGVRGFNYQSAETIGKLNSGFNTIRRSRSEIWTPPRDSS